ncbi:MAG: hypothetical protein II379_02855, partial [Oscillospiraceae bacterium]|nr:hypothetical protein [Oscillospiraceae bacterium]
MQTYGIACKDLKWAKRPETDLVIVVKTTIARFVDSLLMEGFTFSLCFRRSCQLAQKPRQSALLLYHDSELNQSWSYGMIGTRAERSVAYDPQ